MATDAKVEEKSQVSPTQGTDQGGDASSQSSEAEGQRGVEGDQQTQGQEGAQPAPRTYTQEEVSGIESKKDQEIHQYRQALAQQALQVQIQEAEVAEARAQADDRVAIESGELTELDAKQNQQQRLDAGRQDRARRQTIAQEQEMIQGLRTEGEQLGRVMAAEDFAKEYGIDREKLLKDTSLKTPDAMKLKARELQLDKREAALNDGETFDGGQGAGAGVDLSNMSPMDLALHAYGDAETARRNKSRRR